MFKYSQVKKFELQNNGASDSSKSSFCKDDAILTMVTTAGEQVGNCSDHHGLEPRRKSKSNYSSIISLISPDNEREKRVALRQNTPSSLRVPDFSANRVNHEVSSRNGSYSVAESVPDTQETTLFLNGLFTRYYCYWLTVN